MAEPSPRGVLNHLIESCRDAERGFVHAGELVTDPALKTLFGELAARRAQCAANLLPHAQRLGGASTADGTAGASLHRRWMDVRSTLSGHDDHAILREVVRGDTATLLAFKTALEGSLPATVRDLVDTIYTEVRETHHRLEAVDAVPTL